MTERRITFTDATVLNCASSGVKDEHLAVLEQMGIFQSIEYIDDDELQVDELDVDIEELVEFAFRYTLLDEVAGHAQVSALKFFHEQSGSKFTTKEVTEGTDYSQGSISRALNRLAEEEFLTKSQNGVYVLED